MSTVMYRGLQSCLDSQVKETDTLLLTLTAPKSIQRESLFPENNMATSHMIPNLDIHGWSFLQSLSNSSQPKISESFSSPRLNEKSLELCTENLGSETGSDTSERSILESRFEKPTREHQQNIKKVSRAKKANSRSFPPPLTTIRSSNSYQVRPHREDGRLIIKVVEAPSIGTCFEAHRAHGRLQLRMCCINIMNKDVDGNESDVDGNESDVEVKVGMEKIGRPQRCKESGKVTTEEGLCHREPFWVAT
ncbi:protein FANTASTIC FOUR 3 [Heracleum sosnowskyi]|uniref:Protein FANTASTIC FOUR 3 n=1 Tax=Heracleum sosnowskyi TaxID=360622 RepID=A0AAD8I6M3_9APIA|nr:protein FANTASTIC FOUR 3 [Heracleum sosnowskyi]